MNINVQFSDSTEATIVSYFCCPQDPEAHPNLGTVDTTDARYATFYQSLASGSQFGLPVP